MSVQTEVWDIVPYLSGLPKAKRDAASVMAVQVYVDDSGTGRNGPVFVLAACEAPASNWARLSDEWDAIRRAHPPIEYFKASECFALRGQFEKFTEIERDEKAQAFAKILRKYVKRVYLFHVEWNLYDEIFLNEIDARYDNPYLVMCYDLIEQFLAIYIELDQRFEIIFDQSQGISKLITDVYSGFRDRSRGTTMENVYRNIMPVLPLFRDEKEAIPLQAADMIAWFFRRIFSKEAIPYGATHSLDEIQNIDFHVFDTDRQFLEDQKSMILKALPEGTHYFHQFVKVMKNLDDGITAYNLEKISTESYPTLSTLSTRILRQRRLVQSCKEIDRPHLHTRDGKQCLPESA